MNASEVRVELLSRLEKLSGALPEMRFGQLISNLAVVARGTEPAAVWDMEDEELLAAVNWQLEELASRRGPAAAQSAADSLTLPLGLSTIQ